MQRVALSRAQAAELIDSSRAMKLEVLWSTQFAGQMWGGLSRLRCIL
jgi:hypothetical protein